MQDCRPMATPMITNLKKIDASGDRGGPHLVQTTHWVADVYLVNTRLDICFAVNTLSQFMVEPKRVHWATTRHIINADWAGNSVDRKSTFGVLLQCWIRMISWCRKKQKSVALSSTEAEYMATNTTMCEAIWLRKLLVILFKKRMEATRIYCNNQSCIKLSENPIFHDRSKHIDIRCHFIRDCVQRGVVQLQYVPRGDQVANILTKALGRAKFIQFIEQMDAVLAVIGSTTIQMQHLRSGWWAVMSDISNAEGDVTEQGDASTGRIARAHSSLRGSVDLS
eukprot:PITA_02480